MQQVKIRKNRGHGSTVMTSVFLTINLKFENSLTSNASEYSIGMPFVL